MVGLSANNDLERMRDEAAAAYFRYNLGETEENHDTDLG
jgi:hypothetical protein